MKSQSLFSSWGITFSENSNSSIFLPENLSQNFPERCYLADFFPQKIDVEYADKFDQIEARTTQIVYDRMYNVLLKLWALDDLCFESAMLDDQLSCKRISCFKSLKRKAITKNSDENDLISEKQLQKLWFLSKKNVIDLAVMSKKMQLAIIPSWSCIFVFINNPMQMTFISELFNMEGLYLRPMQPSETQGDGSPVCP